MSISGNSRLKFQGVQNVKPNNLWPLFLQLLPGTVYLCLTIWLQPEQGAYVKAPGVDDARNNLFIYYYCIPDYLAPA